MGFRWAKALAQGTFLEPNPSLSTEYLGVRWWCGLTYVLSKTATLLGEACRSLSCLDFPVSILFHSFPSFSINFHHFPSFSQTEGFSSLWGVTTIGSLPTAGPQAWLNLAVRLGILKSKEVYKYSISMYIISAYHHFPIFSPLKCCI